MPAALRRDVSLPPMLRACAGTGRGVTVDELVIWLSRGGVRSKLHFDGGDFFLMQVDGTKEVTLVDPLHSLYLYAHARAHMRSAACPHAPPCIHAAAEHAVHTRTRPRERPVSTMCASPHLARPIHAATHLPRGRYADFEGKKGDISSGLYGFSPIDPAAVDLTKYPLAAHTPTLHVTLSAGDVLFIPHRWWHVVSSLPGRNLALTIQTMMRPPPSVEAQNLGMVSYENLRWVAGWRRAGANASDDDVRNWCVPDDRSPSSTEARAEIFDTAAPLPGLDVLMREGQRPFYTEGGLCGFERHGDV